MKRRRLDPQNPLFPYPDRLTAFSLRSKVWKYVSLSPFDQNTNDIRSFGRKTVLEFNKSNSLLGCSTNSTLNMFDYNEIGINHHELSANHVEFISKPCTKTKALNGMNVQDIKFIEEDSLLLSYNSSPAIQNLSLAEGRSISNRIWGSKRSKDIAGQGTVSLLASKDSNLFLRGTADGYVSIYDVKTHKNLPIMEMKIRRDNKVVATQIFRKSTEDNNHYFHCATSNGKILLYDMRKKGVKLFGSNAEAEAVSEININRQISAFNANTNDISSSCCEPVVWVKMVDDLCWFQLACGAVGVIDLLSGRISRFFHFNERYCVRQYEMAGDRVVKNKILKMNCHMAVQWHNFPALVSAIPQTGEITLFDMTFRSIPCYSLASDCLTTNSEVPAMTTSKKFRHLLYATVDSPSIRIVAPV